MASVRKEQCSLADVAALAIRPDAERLLIRPIGGVFSARYDVLVFPSRPALEGFNKKAGLRPVVFTQVPINCVVWKHESDSEARAALRNED